MDGGGGGGGGALSSMDAFDSFLFSLSNSFSTPLALFIQIQGCIICLVLAFGWACAAYVRNREIKRIKGRVRAGNSFAFICNDISELEHSNQVNLPRVTVIMPLKGFGEHNLHNWRSQVTSLYGGPLEFLFVVESTEDPAYSAVLRLLSDYRDEVDARILVAGLATTCSQKIHNQLIGVEQMHKDSKYVLFLDDDVRLHPGTIGALTAEMEKNPDIFIQTGYPLDLPSGSLGSYCIYEYHMPCSMGFATGGKTFFLWGGCMMMHADDFRYDRYGVVSGLQDGGYSDDMTLAAIAGAHKRLITSPPVAIFPHPLASDLNLGRYWNYLRKQTFVLESYTSHVNKMMNRALFTSHCYLSWGFVAPYFMSMIHVAAALRFYAKGYSLQETGFSTVGMTMVCSLAACTIIELFSMWNLTRVEVHLCNILSPEAPQLSLASYNWGLVFIAILVDNFLYTISAIRSHFSQSINWSGIRYYLKDGKIHKDNSCFSSSSSSSSCNANNKSMINWKEYAPKIDDYNNILAKAIAEGTGQIVQGIFKCSNSYANQVNKGGEMILNSPPPVASVERSVSSPSATKNNKTSINQSLKRVRKMTKMTEKLSKSMLDMVGVASGSVMGPVMKSQAGRAFFAMVPGQVLLASLDAVNKIMDAAEAAEKQALLATTQATTRMVSNKFGESAGEATGDVLATAGHCANTAWNVFKIRKAINPASSVSAGALKNAAKTRNF